MADIVISAGHGTKVAGTSGNGMTEVAEARKVGQRVTEILNENKVETIYYHDEVSTNQKANLNHLVNYHNKQNRKLDVSIHFNNSGGNTSQPIGTEVFYKSGNGTAHKMAATVSAAMALAGGFKNRGAKTKSLAFTNNCKANPILLEIGFMNSSHDMALYKKNFEAICQAIAFTLARCVGKEKKKDEWKGGEISQDVANLKLSVSQSDIQGVGADEVGTSIGSDIEGLEEAFQNGSVSTAANADGGFRVTTSGDLVIIDKQPLEETPASPVYPDLVAPQKTPEEYVQPMNPLLERGEEEEEEGNQSYDVASEINFDTFIKKGIDIAKIFFDYEDYQKRSIVYDNTEHKYRSKIPNFGKPANNNDPFPVDEKIEELEQHLPFMKIHRLSFYRPHTHTVQLAKVIMDLSDKVEKRMIQVENNLATLYRNTFRLGSRININCVYYGGQSEFHKYKTIRCLHHDRVNDGQIMTLDQCLNCTRYEPILGKVYEIENELGRSLDLINDDNQMAYQQMQDSIDQTKLEEKPDPKAKHFLDLEQIKQNERVDGDKDFKEMWPEGFIMDWDFVPAEKQTPHVRYDDGRTSERLPSNYKNIEHHNDPTGAGFEGIGIFYGPTGSTFYGKIGYGGGWSPSGLSGGGGTTGSETTTIQSSEEVRKQVEKNEEVFKNVPSSSDMYQHLEAARKWSSNVDSALRTMKSDFPEIEEWIKQCAAENDLDPLLVLSICITESTGRYNEGEKAGNAYIGLMAVGKDNLPSNYMSLGKVEKMKANIKQGCRHLAAKRAAVWGSNNIVNLAIAYNSGQALIIGNSLKGYPAVYSPGLDKSNHNSWTYDQIWSNFVRNLQGQWPGETKRQTEKKQYYPKVHYVYSSLLQRDVAKTLSNAPVAKEVGVPMIFPYPSNYYKSKINFTSDYGKRIINNEEDWHDGIDLNGGGGTPIVAAAKGIVTKVARGYNGGAGNYIEITHDGGVKTRYLHLNDSGIVVNKGDTVEPGTPIAKEGNTGKTYGKTGNHLHFEIRNAQGKSVDPKLAFPYLKGQLNKKVVVP